MEKIMKLPSLNPIFHRHSQKGYIKTLNRKDGRVLIKKYDSETKKLASVLTIFKNGDKQYKEVQNGLIERKVDFHKNERLYQVRNPHSNTQSNRFLLKERLEKYGCEFLDLDWISFIFDEKGRQTAYKTVKKFF